MSDARSLLRAHKAQASTSQSVQDPFATTTSRGELRCSICVVPAPIRKILVKHWAAHTASKQHRTSIQRVKAEEEKAAAKAVKRRKPDGPSTDIGLPEPSTGASEAFEADSVAEMPSIAKKTKREQVADKNKLGAETVDDELDSFLSSLAETVSDSPSTSDPLNTKASGSKPAKKPYKPSQAETITQFEAAPMLIIPDAEGTIAAAPSAATNPFAGRMAPDVEGPVGPSLAMLEEDEEETEAERRARLEREEREEIMDRLEEETRVQEDADERVQALKAKLEAVKRMRRERQQHKNPRSSELSGPIATNNMR